LVRLGGANFDFSFFVIAPYSYLQSSVEKFEARCIRVKLTETRFAVIELGQHQLSRCLFLCFGNRAS